MKNLTTLALFLNLSTLAQSPVYSWEKKVDPGWISSNPSENTLSYQGFNNDHNGVSTSSYKETFNNNQITSYTSPVYDLRGQGSVLIVDMILGIKLKDIEGNVAFDWLYFQYSLDGGLTWLNPVNASSFKNGSNIDLTQYSLGLNSNKGWAGNLSEHEVESYKVSNTGKNQFRYVFVSNGTINQGNGNGEIYHADIRDFILSKYSPLPIHYVNFKGFNEGNTNTISWTTLSEENNDYFSIQRSSDGVTYDDIGRIQGAGSSKFSINYEFKDENAISGTNYYRFIQYDYNGKKSISSVISVDNNNTEVTIVTTYDLSGRLIDENYEGVRVVQYSNGVVKKLYTIKN